MATARDRHYYTRPARSIVVVTLAVTMLMYGHHAHAWSPCSCMVCHKGEAWRPQGIAHYYTRPARSIVVVTLAVTMLMCGRHAHVWSATKGRHGDRKGSPLLYTPRP